MAAGLACGERLFHRKRNARPQSIAETGACRFGAWLARYCRASPQNGQPRRQKFCLSETYYAPMGIRHFAEKMLLTWLQWSLESLSPQWLRHTVMYTAMRPGSMLFVV